MDRREVEVDVADAPDTFFTNVEVTLFAPATTNAPAPITDAEAMTMVTAAGIFMAVVLLEGILLLPELNLVCYCNLAPCRLSRQSSVVVEAKYVK